MMMDKTIDVRVKSLKGFVYEFKIDITATAEVVYELIKRELKHSKFIFIWIGSFVKKDRKIREMIVEGSCDFTVVNKDYNDYFE